MMGDYGRLAYKASISWSIIAEVPDDAPCVSPNLRTILMTAVSTWKKILGEGLRVDMSGLSIPHIYIENILI